MIDLERVYKQINDAMRALTLPIQHRLTSRLFCRCLRQLTPPLSGVLGDALSLAENHWFGAEDCDDGLANARRWCWSLNSREALAAMPLSDEYRIRMTLSVLHPTVGVYAELIEGLEWFVEWANKIGVDADAFYTQVAELEAEASSQIE